MTAILEQKIRTEATQHAEFTEGPQRRLLRGYLHKTSNGLCGIKGYASLIAAADISEESSVRWAKKIIHEVERMEEIFRSVGDLSHPTASDDVAAGIADVVAGAMVRGQVRHAGLTVDIGCIPAGELIIPAADLGMILDEILANCAESADQRPEGVHVRIRGMVGHRDRVSLIIEDDGPGMDEALLRQAAEPFVTTREGHLGIGLTRIETLLDMYGLAWELTSEPDFGTTFTVEVGEFAGWISSSEQSNRKAGNG
jgi:signal transduction histidine kinase